MKATENPPKAQGYIVLPPKDRGGHGFPRGQIGPSEKCRRRHLSSEKGHRSCGVRNLSFFGNLCYLLEDPCLVTRTFRAFDIFSFKLRRREQLFSCLLPYREVARYFLLRQISKETVTRIGMQDE